MEGQGARDDQTGQLRVREGVERRRVEELRKGQETRVGEGLGLDAGATGEGGGGEAQEQSEDAAGKLQREVTGMMMGGGGEEEEENKGRRSARERYI